MILLGTLILMTSVQIFIENKSKLVYIFKQLYFWTKRLVTTCNYEDALRMCHRLEKNSSYKILKTNAHQLDSTQHRRFCIR